jgi:Na+/H+ antiporter NhaD/arsenite permease-like protein
MEHLGFYNSLAYLLQHPFYPCKLLRRSISCACAAEGAGRDAEAMISNDGGEPLPPPTREDTGDSVQLAKNALVLCVLAGMTALFLLGPLMKVGADVGGIAFFIGLLCLVGLGIASARWAGLPALAEEEEEQAAAAAEITTRAAASPTTPGGGSNVQNLRTTTRHVIEHAREKLFRHTILASKSSRFSQSSSRGNESVHSQLSNSPSSSFYSSTAHDEAADDADADADDLLGRRGTMVSICIVSAVLSALINSDTVALVFAPMLVSKLQGVDDRFPYLLALACASDIGAALTNVGSPQNTLIAITADLDFAVFVKFNFLPVVACMVINIAMLLWWPGHKEELRASQVSPTTSSARAGPTRLEQGRRRGGFAAAAAAAATPSPTYGAGGGGGGGAHELVPVRPGGGGSSIVRDDAHQLATIISERLDGPVVPMEDLGEREPPSPGRASGPPPPSDGGTSTAEALARTPATPPPAAAAAALWLSSSSSPLSSPSASSSLLLSPATAPIPGRGSRHRGRQPAPPPLEDKLTPAFLQEHIETPLLMLFIGQFIMVQGLVNTGIPQCFWEATMQERPLQHPLDCFVFVTAIVVLSNLISNVPLILLMRPMLSRLMREDPDEARATWLIVAFASTMAGNLLLIGSASNLIIASSAQEEEKKCAIAEGREEQPSMFPTAKHARFGVPLTLLTTAVGVSILYLELKVWGWTIVAPNPGDGGGGGGAGSAAGVDLVFLGYIAS